MLLVLASSEGSGAGHVPRGGGRGLAGHIKVYMYKGIPIINLYKFFYNLYNCMQFLQLYTICIQFLQIYTYYKFIQIINYTFIHIKVYTS